MGELCVVVVEIITLYQVQTGHFLVATGYVAPSPNHVQNNVQKRSECISTNRLIKGKENTLQKYQSQPPGSELLSPQDAAWTTHGPQKHKQENPESSPEREEGRKTISQPHRRESPQPQQEQTNRPRTPPINHRSQTPPGRTPLQRTPTVSDLRPPHPHYH